MDISSSKDLNKYYNKRFKKTYNKTSNEELIELIQLYNRNQDGENSND